MGGWLWADSDYGWSGVHRAHRSRRGGGLATGRAFAQSLEPAVADRAGDVALAAAVQFLHYALFQEDLLSLHYYLVTWWCCSRAACFGYQTMRARQMATQYSWAFEKVGLTWRAR